MYCRVLEGTKWCKVTYIYMELLFQYNKTQSFEYNIVVANMHFVV